MKLHHSPLIGTLLLSLALAGVWTATAQEKPRLTLYPLTAEEAVATVPVEERKRIEQLRERILSSTATLTEEAMTDYSGTITKSGKAYEMVRIPGGEFLMGSPPEEAGRHEDEGPQVRVRISPFWMARFETTWEQFEAFAKTEPERNRDGTHRHPETITDPMSPDWVSSPTSPMLYAEVHGANHPKNAVVSITHHAANKFCEWLSFQTGHFYRLPTEAEWEYACRAGTNGAYSYPDADWERFAIYDPEQTRGGPELVGSRKPNPWGLHDMHGNVMEWCLDQYDPEAYQKWAGEVLSDPWVKPQTRYPRVVRGGSWYDLQEEGRSARRLYSTPIWHVQDPQIPKSLWYLTDASWLGFRITRPLRVPTVDEMIFAWNNSLVAENEEEALKL